ncbi:adenylate kinase family protein [Candidatus Similichlamydia laticola]|uniref:Adenylate kinase n=1 Tax=Candidatus Similichlamydia laticola TaxID=2170265 RepID=A0A369KIH9_9BACT|nr:nucleoside monophosphate kinase [Candidatus Similichlamydia laticola]RDB31593.1 adenylate kinase [Candidatus Similichlamydia laticola]
MAKSAIRSILLLGPPGSGKGTLGKSLSDLMGIPHLSTGDLVRRASPSSPLGRACSHLSDSGSLISDKLIFSTFEDYLKGLLLTFQMDEQSWILLDGIPRTAEQVDLVSNVLNLSVVLRLHVSDTVLLKRITERASSQGRVDDLDMDVVHRRITIYNEHVGQILSKLDSSRVFTIEADKHRLLVLAEALSFLVPFLDA